MKKALIAALIAAVYCTPANAAVLLVNPEGRLTGATSVNVDGTLYDVTFANGPCSDIFSGCDESSDFAFNSATTAGLAAQALLDQVFINDVSAFDDNPTLTFGCEGAVSLCQTAVPYGVSGPNLSVRFALNFSPSAGSADRVSDLSFAANFPDNNQFNYAIFSRSTSAIPEPATWAMMLIGFGAVGYSMRRSRNRRTTLAAA
jgi:hypothetical protein